MRCFKSDPYEGIDGSWLMADCGTRFANERDMDRFFRRVEPDLDRLTMEMCADERRQGNRLPEWMLKAELEAFNRIRQRTAA